MSSAPIFIVGCPRSGTTMLYGHMARHPDLAWISNVTKRVAASPAAVRLLLALRSDPRPTEAKRVWGRYSVADHHVLGRADVTPQARAYFRKVVETHLRVLGKKRFLCKCPQNSLRIGFFHEILPDAVFVHVVRDGRAVANSILRSREKHGGEYWGCRPPEWRAIRERPLLEAAAIQWKTITERTMEEGCRLPPERYLEVRYEEICDHPEEAILDLSQRIGLEWDRALLRGLVGDVKSRNWKWREAFRPEEIESLHREIGDLLARLGYEVAPQA